MAAPPQVFDPDEAPAGQQVFDPDEPVRKPRKAGFFEGTGAAIEQGFGHLAGTAVRGIGMAASTMARSAEIEAQGEQQNEAILRGIDIGAGKAGDYADDTLSQAIIGASDRLATRTEEAWEPKKGQKIGMGAKIAAGIATVGGFPLTYAISPVERATEILKAALGAGVNVGIAAAQPAVEAAVAPGIPQEAKLQQPGAEELTVAGLVGAAGGVHGAHGERAAERQRQMQERIAARPDFEQLSPTDQMKVASGEVPQADQAKTAAKAHGIDASNIEHGPLPGAGEAMAKAARAGGIQEIEGAPAPGGEQPEGIQEIKGAPAPKERAPTGGEPRAPDEQLAAGPVKSARQVELERLREQAATPEGQRRVDELIASEKRYQQKAWDAEEKAREGAVGASEMRRLAGQTQDPQIREELLARAEKLAPTPEPETKVQKTGTELQKTGTTGGQGELGMAQGETGAPAAAGPPAAAAEPAAPRQHTTGSSPFFQRIADELGGIHTSSRSDAGFDRLKAVLIGGKKPNGSALSAAARARAARLSGADPRRD